MLRINNLQTNDRFIRVNQNVIEKNYLAEHSEIYELRGSVLNELMISSGMNVKQKGSVFMNSVSEYMWVLLGAFPIKGTGLRI